MGKLKLLSCFFIALIFWSCRSNDKYPYAIKDFRKELQPQLTQMVARGIVEYPERDFKDATDKELERLGNSEHPILRAAAFRVMLDRKSFDHFKIMMNHLDDTAIVFIDAGEWGTWFRSVSDDIISHTRWKTMADKNKTIEAVITKHNYLRSAYTILNRLAPQEKYYAYIKEMTSRYDYNYPWVDSFDPALFGLAKFRKQEDIPYIKEMLLKSTWRMNSDIYSVLNEYPDPSYMEVFEKFYRQRFYSLSCQERYPDQAKEFINSVAGYKSYGSAAILESILNKKIKGYCVIKPGWLQDAVARAVWKNPCEAYTGIRKQVAQQIKNFEKEPGGLTVSPPVFSDTLGKENISWLWP